MNQCHPTHAMEVAECILDAWCGNTTPWMEGAKTLSQNVIQVLTDRLAIDHRKIGSQICDMDKPHF